MRPVTTTGKTLGLGLVALGALQPVISQAEEAPTEWQRVEARVGSILDNMSLSEKINYTGVDDGHMFPRLDKWGIEGTVAYDSSLGVHVNNATFGAQFPSLTALSATWNIDRAEQYGLAIGYETRLSGGQQMLSPSVNLYRTPFGGRAAENISGEDPFLGAVMAPAVVNGIQAQGIQASGKHYLANEQEANRQNVNIHVDERTLRELYLPGFESMVKNADIASIMCGFNKINGDYACENHHLITDILKGEWGYQGSVISDFNAIHDPLKGAWAGTDLDMPTGLQFTEEKLMPLLWSGQLTEDVIDDKVRRNLRAVIKYDFQEDMNTAQPLEHPEYGARSALDTAREGIVLLRNEDNRHGQPLLPLDRDAKIAVIGNIADEAPPTPFGTANATPETYISELVGLRQLAERSSRVTYLSSMSLDPETAEWHLPGDKPNHAGERGVKAEYFDNATLSGEPAETRVEPGVNLNWMTGTNETSTGSTSLSDVSTTAGDFSARFTTTIEPTTTGRQVFKVRADGPYKLWVDGELVLESDGVPYSSDVVNALVTSGQTQRLRAGRSYDVRLEYRRLQDNFTAVLGGLTGVQMSWAAMQPPHNLARYDAVVVAVGNTNENEGEASDHGYALPDQQAEQIANVASANPNTVVVMHGGGISDMTPWIDRVGAALQVWNPGQQAGQALAEILYGEVNPSGKLPMTIDRDIEDNPSYASYPDPALYRGEDALTEMDYSEGLYMGYRGYDEKSATPLFPFGFGLSYTTFDYADLQLSSNVMTPGNTIDVSFTLTNTGDRAGFEVAQLYVQPLDPKADRPVKELKGFTKVYLEPGESRTASIPIDARSLAYYTQRTDSWDVDAGDYRIHVGGSSVDLPLNRTLTTLMDQQLTTRDSNPLPAPVQQAVQVDPSQTY